MPSMADDELPEENEEEAVAAETAAESEQVDDREILTIETEEEAWELLDRILKDEIDAENIRIDLTSATWAKFRVIYRGKPFDQSVTPSTMQGIVDYQAALYRSIAIALRDSRKISNLTDDEKEAFELVFKVSEGSSDLGADAKDILAELSKAFSKMSGKQISICAIVIAVLYFGQGGFTSYLSHVGDSKKIELEQKKAELDADNAKGLRDIINKLADNSKEKDRILEDAKNKNEKVAAIEDEASKGFDSIIRHSTKVDEIVVQGQEINKRSIQDITSIKRRQSVHTTFNATYTISGVDTTDPRGFVVKLQDVSSEQVITATLFDLVGREKFGGVIQRAEWGKTKIVVRLAAKRIGEDIVEARILKAHTARTRTRR